MQKNKMVEVIRYKVNYINKAVTIILNIPHEKEKKEIKKQELS